MAQIAYVDWDGLYYYDGKIKQYIANKFQDDLKVGTAVDDISKLPDPSVDHLNYIFQITEEFTADNRFEYAGTYPAGSWVKISPIIDSETGVVRYMYTIFSTAGLTPEAHNRLSALEYDTAELEEVKANRSELENYTSTEELQKTYATLENLKSYALLESLEAKADKSTTLAGYAIEDAYTKTEIDNALAAKVSNDEFTTTRDNLDVNIKALSSDLTAASQTIADLEDTCVNLDLNKAAKNHTHTTEDILGADFASYANKEDVKTALDAKADKAAVVTTATFTEYKGAIDNKFEYVDSQIIDIKDDLSKVEADIKDDLANIYTKAEVYTKDEVRNLLSGQSPEVPSEYVTEGELEQVLNSKGYVTEAQANATYTTTAFVKDALDHVEGKIPKDYVTTSDLNSRGYVTSAAVDGAVATAIAATETKLNDANAQKYLSKTSAEEIYTTKQYADGKYLYNTVNATYATQDYVTQKIAEAKLDPEEFGDITALLSDYYKKGETYSKDEVYSKNETYDQSYINNNFANKSWVNEQGFAKNSEVQAELSSKAKQSDLTTLKTTVDNLVIPADTSDLTNNAGFITESALAGYSKFSGYYEDLPDKPSIPSKVSELENDDNFTTLAEVAKVGYLTEHQSLDGYATKDWVENQNYITSDALEQRAYAKASDLEAYAKADSVPKKVSDLENDEKYQSEAEVSKAISAAIAGKANTEHQHTLKDITDYKAPDLSKYYDKAEVDNLIPKVNDFISKIPSEYITEDELDQKGYLTEHQSLADYATTRSVNDAIKVVTDSIGAVAEGKTVLGMIGEVEGKIPTNNNQLTNGAGYQTADDVANAIADIEFPEIDTSKLATKGELAAKADNILFTEEYKVTTPIGSFTEDQSVKDMSLREIIINLLGLKKVEKYSLKFFVDGELYDEHFYEEGQKINPPADPVKDGYNFDGWKIGDFWITDASTMPNSNVEAHAVFEVVPEGPKDSVTLEEVKELGLPILSSSSKNGVIDAEYQSIIYHDAESYSALPAESFKEEGNTLLYEYYGSDGTLKETGYQTYAGTTGKGNYYQVAIPKGLTITKVYKDGISWAVYEDPEGHFEKIDELTIGNYVYDLYQDSNLGTGQCYRFVIE